MIIITIPSLMSYNYNINMYECMVRSVIKEYTGPGGSRSVRVSYVKLHS